MKVEKTTFALFFGNRGFFPSSLMESARAELSAVLQKLGHNSLMLDADATRVGAVETPHEGEVYANFLRQNRGKFGGVILCLPNFGDETGAVAALQDAGVPILIQAYPDEMDKMSPECRRDAFCGKFSVMDVFHQYQIPFTALKPHAAAPTSDAFAANIDYFDRVCRVASNMKGMIVGAVGARTTPFKTVRFDELALQRHGITVETLDLSSVFHSMKSVDPDSKRYIDTAAALLDYTCWQGVPDRAVDNLTRLCLVLEDVIEEYNMDSLAVRCWVEMQTQLGISPCVLLSYLNDRQLPVACEVDVGNAVAMYALGLATGETTTCLDWNNNYGDEDEKCILFHCGPVPQSMMTAKGQVTDHEILKNATGPGLGYGCNVGRIAPTPFTFGSVMTEDGRVKMYLGSGNFTSDPIPESFFGCAGVAEIPGLQDVLLHVGYNGHRHHVSVSPGPSVVDPVAEACTKYLGFDVSVL